jgi:predicted flavoprotein YhiN
MARASEEAMLFTHRGLSGPAMLQISSYWRDGDTAQQSTWRQAP